LVEVTHAITTGPFRFTEHFNGLDVMSERRSVIGHDAAQPGRTPYDDCVLIMPSRARARPDRGPRLGRLVD
jgi:hypothetical protein